MFLLRTAFWLSVVVLLLPADADTGDKAPRVTALEALVAARTAVSDFSQFCDRNPDVCVTGGSAFHVFTDKVRYGAKMLYGYFGDEKATAHPAGTSAEESTLKPGDAGPAWRKPGKGGSAA